MPRYFFHSLDGYADIDDLGSELEDDDSARTQAVMFLAELLRDNPTQVWDGQALRVKVTDADGAVLFTVVTTSVDGT